MSDNVVKFKSKEDFTREEVSRKLQEMVDKRPALWGKERCLKHYATKEPKGFLQLDGFIDAPEDDVMHPDSDGDCMFGGGTTELMNSADVRILIADGVSRESAARVIRKLADWLEKDKELLSRNMPDPNQIITGSIKDDFPF